MRKQLLPVLWEWRTAEQGWPQDLGVSHPPSHPLPAPRRTTKPLLNLLLSTVCTAGSQPPWPFLQDGKSTVVSIFLLKVYDWKLQKVPTCHSLSSIGSFKLQALAFPRLPGHSRGWSVIQCSLPLSSIGISPKISLSRLEDILYWSLIMASFFQIFQSISSLRGEAVPSLFGGKSWV